jgi:enoyl-CoA hydratase/carnithine racemase
VAILVERRDHVAIITIDRPEARNAIDLEHNRLLEAAWRDFAADPDLWLAILTATGDKAFSAGADLKTLIPAQREGVLPDWNFGGLTRGFQTWKPIIAAVNGPALAGGMEMVLACDLRVAAENATFALTEVRWAIIPGAGGTQRLPRSVPLASALEMILTAEPISAAEAFRLGLVNRVVPLSGLMETAWEMAESILRHGPLAVRAAKEAVYRGLALELEEGLALELDLFNRVMHTEDAREGPQAFAERRSPRYRGV